MLYSWGLGLSLISDSDWIDLPRPIGLLGGSFDPVQIAHIEIARAALVSGLVKSVVFIPAKQNPLKANSPIAKIEDRITMLQIALDGIDNCYISNIEALLPTPSYTYDTICQIQKFTSQSAEILFLGGTDLLEDLHKWHKIHEVLKILSGFVVFSRNILAKEAIYNLSGHFSKDEVGLFKPIDIDIKFKEISASEFRKLQLSGKKIQNFVPKKVLDFVLQNNIYSNK